jgi:hypothetical protein
MVLRGILRNTVYVKVRANRFDVRHIEGQQNIQMHSSKPFTTQRLLVGEFAEAEACLREALRKLNLSPYLAAPTVVIHPLEKVEGGLSGIEHRALLELADCAGAKRAVVWVGHELADTEVLRMASQQ